MHVMNHNWSATKQVSSSAECSRDKPLFSFVRGQCSTMWDIIWVSPQGHRSVSVSRHFLLQALQSPCSMRKRFSRDHCCRGRSKPGCRIVGSHTRWTLIIIHNTDMVVLQMYKGVQKVTDIDQHWGESKFYC